MSMCAVYVYKYVIEHELKEKMTRRKDDDDRGEEKGKRRGKRLVDTSSRGNEQAKEEMIDNMRSMSGEEQNGRGHRNNEKHMNNKDHPKMNEGKVK